MASFQSFTFSTMFTLPLTASFNILISPFDLVNIIVLCTLIILKILFYSKKMTGLLTSHSNQLDILLHSFAVLLFLIFSSRLFSSIFSTISIRLSRCSLSSFTQKHITIPIFPSSKNLFFYHKSLQKMLSFFTRSFDFVCGKITFGISIIQFPKSSTSFIIFSIYSSSIHSSLNKSSPASLIAPLQSIAFPFNFILFSDNRSEIVIFL